VLEIRSFGFRSVSNLDCQTVLEVWLLKVLGLGEIIFSKYFRTKVGLVPIKICLIYLREGFF